MHTYDHAACELFLKDGKRFILTSEGSGWRIFYLYDLTGMLRGTLT